MDGLHTGEKKVSLFKVSAALTLSKWRLSFETPIRDNLLTSPFLVQNKEEFAKLFETVSIEKTQFIPQVGYACSLLAACILCCLFCDL